MCELGLCVWTKQVYRIQCDSNRLPSASMAFSSPFKSSRRACSHWFQGERKGEGETEGNVGAREIHRVAASCARPAQSPGRGGARNRGPWPQIHTPPPTHTQPPAPLRSNRDLLVPRSMLSPWAPPSGWFPCLLPPASLYTRVGAPGPVTRLRLRAHLLPTLTRSPGGPSAPTCHPPTPEQASARCSVIPARPAGRCPGPGLGGHPGVPGEGCGGPPAPRKRLWSAGARTPGHAPMAGR